MRYIRYAAITIFAVALILIALANRGMVSLQLLPDGLAVFSAVNPSYEVPLFIVIFGGVLVGLVVGRIWEWLSEAKDRMAAARQAREMQQMRAEIRRLKGEKHQGKDEVLAILDETG